MRAVRLIPLAVVVVLLLVSAAWAQTGNPPANTGEAVEQIRSLQKQLLQAILKADTNFLQEHYADDYTAIHGDGSIHTKSEEIETFKSGAIKYDSIDVHDSKVRIYGDSAIVNAQVSLKAIINGKPYNGDVRNTRVWVKQNGQWKLAAFQATRVAGTSQ